MMKILKDYFDTDLLSWLHDNGVQYKLANIKLDKGELNLLYNDKFCLKFYDRIGHGFGVTVNLADKYDESIYDNDIFSLTWAFEYLKIKETASFENREANQYLKGLPNLIADIKNIVPRLNEMTSLEWDSMIEWINKEAAIRFVKS
jgi:hypothetical protein